MMHRNFATTIANDTPIDSTQLAPSLYSPFSYAISVGEPNMIKQAAPQHPHGLTKLQHRLLYESDSESSLDLSFSSPSSIGSTSEYSDVGYLSSSKSRSRSSGFSRHAGAHSSGSRSGSISSVLGSSMAIQRVMMGSAPSFRTSQQSQRQSVRSIASAFEAASRTGTARAPSNVGTQLGRVEEQSVSRGQGSRPSTLYSTSSGRSTDNSSTVPARLKIVKQSIKGPMSAPVTSEMPQTFTSNSGTGEPTAAASHFAFPPRTPSQKRWPYDQSDARVRSFISLDGQPDDDEPAFEIVLSPSRKRSTPLPSAAIGSSAADMQQGSDTPRVSLTRSPSTLDSDPLSSLSAASRDSLDSSYSLDSLGDHPFSLQLPGEDEFDLRASSAASIRDADDIDTFRSSFIGSGDISDFICPPAPSGRKIQHASQHMQPTTQLLEAPVASARAASLQPLLLSTSRPSSSASSTTTTLTSIVQPAASMRVNEDTSFPLPPTAVARRSISPGVRDQGKMSQPLRGTISAQSQADQSLAAAQLKQQAAELLASIRSLADEIVSSNPPTHRLPGSAYKASPLSTSDSINTASSAASTPSFVAVDESYSNVWRLMDQWYWSSFEVGPAKSPLQP